MAVTHKNPIFNDENAAREHFEALRWPSGPTCPFCSTQDRVAVLGGKSMGPGWYHCKDCRKKFTALVGTVYERSHIPLTMWLYVTHLMCASKKGISSHQIMRMTGLTYKSAWFMTHRIREAMTNGDMSPMGGDGGIVEIDETFIGKKEGAKVRRGFAHKHAVMSLVERRPEGARVRSFHVSGTASADLLPVIKVHVSPATHVMTDEAGQYTHMGKHFAAHDFTTHSKGEYVRSGARYVHTNTVEGYYSVFKRGMVGIYQHCAEHHLHRYVAEFDFRYNNRNRLGVDDKARAAKAVSGAAGKRLTYQQTSLRGGAWAV
jgi:transposase-like protein